MTEQWRPVPGFEMYEVSSLGRVRSLFTDRVMSTYLDRDGYPCVTLRINGAKRNRKVSRLVGEAFLQPVESKTNVLHNNGIKTDNYVENLRWGTVSENSRDAVEHGGHPKARKTHCARGHEYTPKNTRWRKDRNHRECIACAQDDSKALRGRLKGTPPRTHGTINAYITHHCRCVPCKDRWSDYQRERRRAA